MQTDRTFLLNELAYIQWLVRPCCLSMLDSRPDFVPIDHSRRVARGRSADENDRSAIGTISSRRSSARIFGPTQTKNI